MTRILVGILAAAAVTTMVMAWAIHHRGQQIDTLTERNARLSGLVDTLSRANHDLATQVRELNDRHQHTLTLVSQAESDKRRIAAELDRTHADLRRALAAEPEWADTPVPSPVAAGVNAALDRLLNSGAGDHHEL